MKVETLTFTAEVLDIDARAGEPAYQARLERDVMRSIVEVIRSEGLDVREARLDLALRGE